MSDKKTKRSSSFSPSLKIQSDSPVYKKRFFNVSTSASDQQLPPISGNGGQKVSIDGKNSRIRTQGSSLTKQESNLSDRQLSRFIYNHLQKKIHFQDKFYEDIAAPYYQLSTDHLDSTNNTQHNTLRCLATIKQTRPPHVYAYQKQQSPLQQSFESGKQLTKLKHRFMKNHCQRMNSLHMSVTKHRNSKRQTHIDAYFDLSCLQNMHQRQKLFCLTNSVGQI